MMNLAYNMDCMEAMRKMPDKCFDLAVVDPPYGIGMGGGKIGRSKRAETTDYPRFFGNDEKPERIEYFVELRRVSKNQIIWGANHFMDRLPEPKSTSCWLVWDKDNGNVGFADCELAWTSFQTATRKFQFRWHGMLQENMKEKEHRIHPTQKPVALYAWIYSRYAKEGDKILDTHIGSGSSRIAAWDAGLDFVGFEIDEEYFQKEEQRFAEHTAQQKIFWGTD